VCRSAGFWQTHAGTEKGAPNLVLELLDAAGDCVVVCGEKIDSTATNSANSALEALCGPVEGIPRTQLARQLTTAVLNCIASGGGSGCALTDIAEQVATCDAICRSSASSKTQISQCIAALTCINEGGEPLAGGFCQKGTCANNAPCNSKSGCSDQSACVPLPDSCADEDLALCAGRKCPASSPGKCEQAKSTSCNIVPPRESSCASGLKGPAAETCAQTSCP
jgi:hypothetical protein